MSNRFSHTLPPTSAEIPEPIKHIYRSVLLDGRKIVCSKVDWMFPIGYKISIFDTGLESIIQDDHIGSVSGRVSDYAIASYILLPGRIITCPVQKDKIE